MWIGIGSNMLDPKKQVDQSIWCLSALPMTKLIAFSSYYRSRPLGKKNQPDFLNAIVILDTDLSPQVLLNYLQYIEKKQGRIRLRDDCVWQSRTLDLDILLFGKHIICIPELIIPHHGIFNREFVIYPLIELNDRLVFPNGKIITDIVRTVPRNGLDLWKS